MNRLELSRSYCVKLELGLLELRRKNESHVAVVTVIVSLSVAEAVAVLSKLVSKQTPGNYRMYIVGVKVLVYDVLVPYESTLLQYGEPTAGVPRIHRKTLSRSQPVVAAGARRSSGPAKASPSRGRAVKREKCIVENKRLEMMW